jgi:hypothetical protein
MQSTWKKSVANIVDAWVCRNCRRVVPVRRCGAWDLPGSEDPADRERADPVAELEQLALDLVVPQPSFPVASRSISAVISALTGGRPVRSG